MRKISLLAKSRPLIRTRSGRACLVACLSLNAVLFGSLSCAHGFGPKLPPSLQQPPREVCLTGNSGCVCFHPLLETPPPGTTPISCFGVTQIEAQDEGVCYVRAHGVPEHLGGCLNYEAMSPIDYNAHQDWIKDNCWGRPKRKP